MQKVNDIQVKVVVGLALLSLAVAWGAALTKQIAMEKDIENIESRMKENDALRERLKSDYMTEKEHDAQNKVATLEMQEYVSETIKKTFSQGYKR